MPSIRWKCLKYAKYSYVFTPLSDAKLSCELLWPNCAVWPIVTLTEEDQQMLRALNEAELLFELFYRKVVPLYFLTVAMTKFLKR